MSSILSYQKKGANLLLGQRASVLNVGYKNLIVIKPESDAQVRGAQYGETNYGDDDYMIVKKDSFASPGANEEFTHRSYLKFDVSRFSTPRSSTKLKLYVLDITDFDGEFTRDVALHRTQTDDWQEDTITWDNSPAVKGTTFVRKPITKDDIGTFVSFDITFLANSEISRKGILSIMLICPEIRDGGARFATKDHENDAFHPKIEVKSALPKSKGFSLLFNGADQTLSLGLIEEFWPGLSEFTFECWMKTNATFRMHMATFGYGESDFGIQGRLNESSQYIQRNGNMFLQIEDEDGSFRLPYRNENIEFNDGQWHHYAVKGSYQTGSFKIIFDGVDITPSSVESGVMNTISNPNVGLSSISGNYKVDGSIGRPFRGQVFAPRLWRRELTIEEIQTNSHKLLGAKEFPNLFISYFLHEGKGDIINSDGNENAGHLIGNINDDMWIKDTPF